MMTTLLRRAGLSLGLAFALTAATGCDIVVGGLNARETATTDWTKTYTLASGGQVEIVNANGSIEVSAVDGTTVEVLARKTAGAQTPEDAKSLLGKIEISEQVSATLVRLETRAPTGMTNRTKVSYTIKVPRTASVVLLNKNGTVSVTGVTGQVRAETVNGGVTAVNVGGSLRASTTNGGVKAEVSGVSGEGISIETTNGGIDLRLPRSAKADLRARCVNGSIDLTDLPVEASDENSRRRIEGRLNGGGPKVDLTTTNGGIRITGQ